jgi:Cys-rich four helix bundle protein (predicted Tat secretion target)
MPGGKYQALADASADCFIKGQACLAHCLILLADGDKPMAACAQSVSQAMALCSALQSLAVQKASLVIALAKTTLVACIKQCKALVA